jgi:hypothetical protein
MLVFNNHRRAGAGNIHEVNVRDKTVAGMLIDNLSRKGKLGEADYAAIPYNALHEWGP